MYKTQCNTATATCSAPEEMFTNDRDLTKNIVFGVSQDNFMFSRSAGNFFTKATAIAATLFIICSLGLTIISRGELTPMTSVIDKIEKNTDDAPKIPE